MTHAINDEALDTIFRSARTQNKWQDKPVSPALLMAVYDLMRWGPTSANVSPARIVFVVSAEAKERLKPHLGAGNRDKTMAAPATAIIGYDLDFAAPSTESVSAQCRRQGLVHGMPTFAETDGLSQRHAARRAISSSPHGRWGWIAGRCRASTMTGVDREFFAGTVIKSNFLCNVGYGDSAGVFARSPRLSFDEACKIV